jgi:hypothetical protein
MTPTKASSDELPPFVAQDNKTGRLFVLLRDLPVPLFEAILEDNSLESGSGPEWYRLRSGITALRFVRQEVEAGSEAALTHLNDDNRWAEDMPGDWAVFVQPFIEPTSTT